MFHVKHLLAGLLILVVLPTFSQAYKPGFSLVPDCCSQALQLRQDTTDLNDRNRFNVGLLLETRKNLATYKIEVADRMVKTKADCQDQVDMANLRGQVKQKTIDQTADALYKAEIKWRLFSSGWRKDIKKIRESLPRTPVVAPQ